MEPTTPTNNEAQIQKPVEPKDNHGMTIVSMAVFVLLSLSIVISLYYQNQKLKGMLAASTALTISPSAQPTTQPTTDPTVNWKTYISPDYGLSFKYPDFYQTDKISQSPKNPGIDMVGFKNAGGDASFHIYRSQTKFTVDSLKKYAPTGSEDLPPIKRMFGQNTFYYYGAGGGGVNYSDQFFYDIDGNILIFVFNGPYGDNEKSPSKEVQTFESQILTTFDYRTPSPTAFDTVPNGY